MKQPAINWHNRGFTLLEVLVALAVIALALIGVVKSSGSVTANTAYLQQKTIAQWVAMDRFMEIENEQEWPSTGSKSDTVEMLGSKWTWIQEVEPLPDWQHLRRVHIHVIQEDGDEDYPLITMTGLVIDPQLLQLPGQAQPISVNGQNQQDQDQQDQQEQQE